MSKISRRSLAAFVAAIAFAVAGFAARTVGDRIVVFGKSAKLLADIHVAQWPKSKHRLLREAIQWNLQSNKPDPRLKDSASKPSRKKKASSV